MSEDVYAKPDFTRKVRFQAHDQDKNVDVEREVSDVIIYDNYLPEEKSTSTSQENLCEEQQPTTPVSTCCGEAALKVAALLLGLLLLLAFLAAVIFFASCWILDVSNGEDRETFSRELKNLSDNLAAEIRQWILIANNVESRYSELKGTVYNLTQKTSQFEKVEHMLAAMTDNLTSLREEVQAREARQCPANWTMFSGSCYFLNTSKNTWQESYDICKGYQANLVIISDVVEQLFLVSLGKRTWIGLTRDKTKAEAWNWVDGSPLTQGYWAADQPDNHGNSEKCAEIMEHQDIFKSWNDNKCDHWLNFVCEKEIV